MQRQMFSPPWRRFTRGSQLWRCVSVAFLLAGCSSDKPAPTENTQPPGTTPPVANAAITEFMIPRARAFPHDPALGADGSVWYTDQTNSYIGRLSPATGNIIDIATPTAGSGPHGIDVAPDGFVYYTAQTRGIIGRVDPRTVVADAANRRIWLALSGTQRIGRLDLTR
jgi:streptogramin lyase